MTINRKVSYKNIDCCSS